MIQDFGIGSLVEERMINSWIIFKMDVSVNYWKDGMKNNPL